MLNKYKDKDVLSPKDVAEILCICKPSVYKLLKDGVIGYKKIGKKYLIPKRSMVDFLSSAKYNNFHM